MALLTPLKTADALAIVHLKQACGDEFQIVLDEVAAGDVILYRLTSKNGQGTVALRREGETLVVVAVAGYDRLARLLEQLRGPLLKLSSALFIKVIRVHTVKAAMARLYRRFFDRIERDGFEYVAFGDVTNGR